MSVTIQDPDPEMLRKWGPLAYVSDQERDRLLSLPFGQFKPNIKSLEKEIKEIKKRKKQNQSEYKSMRRHNT